MNNSKSNSIIDIHSEDVYRLFEQKKRKKKISDYALDNVIVPFPGFDSTVFDEKMWSVIRKKKYGNSYTLYLNSLRVTVELMLAYEDTGEIKYFDKAEEIINSWIEFSHTNHDNKMVWYDHTTANRTQALIQYIYLANQLNRDIDTVMFIDLLKKHAQVMNNDEIYKFNNHGLMMDRSLIVLGNILNDEALVMNGKFRAIRTFLHSFSHQGVHLENSPQYHTMVARMYREIEAYLNKKQDSFGTQVTEYLELSNKYIPIITKPNNRLASIGDSGEEKQKTTKKYDNLFDVQAGISVLQFKKPFSMFLTFIAGYSSRVHKHKDDLSITLNYKLKDFFVDPGKYSYTQNKTRKYITSRKAHSSFYLSDFDYEIKHENRYTRKIKLEDYYDNSVYTLVSGVHNDYDGSSAKLKRKVIQFKEYPVIIIVDTLDTKVQHDLNMTQNFNLATDVSVVEKDGIVHLSNGDANLKIEQFNAPDNQVIIEGDQNKPIAVNSSGFAKVEETKQIQFYKSSNENNIFLTAVYDEDVINNFNARLNENELEVIVNKKKYCVYM